MESDIPTKFCKIIDQERSVSLKLPKKFATKYADKLPTAVYLKVPDGTSPWPAEVTYSKSNNEVWLRKGWSDFRDYYSIGLGYFLEFTWFGVDMFEVMIYDITGLEIEYKYERIRVNVAATDTRGFYKIIVDPESDRLRVPLTFTQRYGADLPDSVSINVPGCTSLWEVILVRGEDGEIYIERGWKEFREYYGIDFGHSLVFQFDQKYALFDVSIYDGTASEKVFRFNLDGVPVERCDSGKGKSFVFEEEIIEKHIDEEILDVEDYDHEDNRTSIGVGEHCSIRQETKRKRDNSDDSVDCLVPKSAQRARLGRDTEAERRTTGVSPRGMRNSGGTVSFTKEIKLNNVYKVDIPHQFIKDNGIDKLTSVTLRDDKGKKWPVRVLRKPNGLSSFGKGWHDFLIGNNVVIGTTFSFVWSSENTIETRVEKEGADKEALFKFVKKWTTKYELYKPGPNGHSVV